MNSKSILSYGLVFAAVGLAYREGCAADSMATSVGVDSITKSAKNREIVEKLNYYVYLIRAGKKTLKWTKKGMKQISAAIESGVFTESLKEWSTSRKALRIYALIIGSCLMSYQNKKGKESVISSLFSESKKIIEAHEFITSIAEFMQKPNEQLLPMAFALAMIASRYLASS